LKLNVYTILQPLSFVDRLMTKSAVKKQASIPVESKSKKKSVKKAPIKGPKISLMVAVLRVLKKEQPQSAPQIAKVIKTSVPIVYLCVANLEKNKLIKAELDKSERRGRKGNVFYLTDAGTNEINKI